jgi:hypothetical protein
MATVIFAPAVDKRKGAQSQTGAVPILGIGEASKRKANRDRLTRKSRKRLSNSIITYLHNESVEKHSAHESCSRWHLRNSAHAIIHQLSPKLSTFPTAYQARSPLQSTRRSLAADSDDVGGPFLPTSSVRADYGVQYVTTNTKRYTRMTGTETGPASTPRVSGDARRPNAA